MRGYLTFLIVFAACLLTISLIQFDINAKYSNSAGALWTERYYQAEMNIKEAVIEAAREGAVEGVVSYCESYAASDCSKRLADGDVSAVPNIDCIEYYVNKKAVEKINSLNGLETDGMAFFISVDPLYSLSYSICETQPCGITQPSDEKRVVSVFNVDLSNLPAMSVPVRPDDGRKALSGAVLQIKKDSHTQKTPITITIKNPGFDDVVFDMPPVSIGDVGP